jgi:hypothetical protein
VALVEHLPERNLGVTRDVDILSAVRDELHKSASHSLLCFYAREFFSGGPRGDPLSWTCGFK